MNEHRVGHSIVTTMETGHSGVVWKGEPVFYAVKVDWQIRHTVGCETGEITATCIYRQSDREDQQGRGRERTGKYWA